MKTKLFPAKDSFLSPLALLLAIQLVTSCASSKKVESDFNLFIPQFIADSAFQKTHIDFPVMKYYSDEDFPLDILERMIDEDNYEFIDIENSLPSELRVNDSYSTSVYQNTDTVSYQISGRNKGASITYKFISKDESFYLVEIEDFTD